MNAKLKIPLVILAIAAIATAALVSAAYVMTSNSVTLHMVLKASSEKIYRAFTDATAMASWIPPYGFLCVVHSMDVKQGGNFRMSFINFSTGNGHSFGGTYMELKPNEFIKYTDKFEDPLLPGDIAHPSTLPRLI